ncbi:MAG: DUF1697 domain-containing protein, partial [Candidatus Thorarchaeota archaeon]
MIVYVALIRGINIFTHNRLKMQQICQLFTECGFINVSSYKQSGNILFESDTSQQLITTMLENAFRRQLGKPITVFIRTVSHLRKM